MSEEPGSAGPAPDGWPRALRADCERCFGLCCVAPAFSASADFAIDKPAGHPCPHLRPDFRCGIHTDLRGRGFRGCAVYDCFGAGLLATAEPRREVDHRNRRLHNLAPISPPRLLEVAVARS